MLSKREKKNTIQLNHMPALKKGEFHIVPDETKLFAEITIDLFE